MLRDGAGKNLSWASQSADYPFCWNQCSPSSRQSYPKPIVFSPAVTEACKTVTRNDPAEWSWGRGAGYGGEFYDPAARK